MIDRRLLATVSAVASALGACVAIAARPAATPTVAAADAALLTPLTPARLLDTRDGPDDTTADGAFRGGGARPARSVLELTVAGRGGVPADAAAVFLNITAVGAEGDGYVTAFPCGTERPVASHVNYTTGATVPNGALVGVGTGGKVCLFTLAATHLLADVAAYVPAGSSPTPLTPARLLDTRGGTGHTTSDHAFEGAGAVPARGVVELQVAGRGNVPADAAAVFLNLTAVGPAAAGYLTAWPCGAERPTASHVNYTAGAVSPNGALVGVGAGGKVCIFTLAATDLLADVTAFVPAGAMPHAVAPARLLDSRGGASDLTVDHQFENIGRVPGGHFVRLRVTGRGSVPADATAVFLNLTAVAPETAGYLTAWPCGSDRPKASHVNYGAGEVRPNGALVGVGTNGQVCIFTLAATHVLADVTAYVAPASAPDVIQSESTTTSTSTTTTSTTTAPATTVAPTTSSTTTAPTTSAPSTTAPPTTTEPEPEPDGCAEPGAAWSTATPAEQGMDAAELQAAVDGAMANQALAVRVYRRGCLVAQDGNPLSEFDQYESWSMAKAFTSLVFGRAWTLGLIGPDDTLGALIPEADAAHGAITMRQLLEQTNGLDLNPVRDYNIATPDRLDTALRTAVVADPGTTWGYSQHGPALLAEAVSRAVQAAGYDDFQDFADRELFSRVGVDRADWYWRRDCPNAIVGLPLVSAALALLPLGIDVVLSTLGITDNELLDGVCASPAGSSDGHTQGFFGLNMHPNDFARFGELMRRDGMWQGQRLLSEQYLAQAVAPTARNGCYGWLFWVNAGSPCSDAFDAESPTSQLFPGLPADLYVFQGFLGQRIAVFPTQDLVVVRLGTQEIGSTLFGSLGAGDTFLDEAQFYAAVLGAITDTSIPAPTPPADGSATHAARAGLSPDAFAGALQDPAGTLGPVLIEHLQPLPAAGPVRARIASGAVTTTGNQMTLRIICPPAPNTSACTGYSAIESTEAGPNLSYAVPYDIAAGSAADVTLTLTQAALAARPLDALATATNANGTRASRELRIE